MIFGQLDRKTPMHETRPFYGHKPAACNGHVRPRLRMLWSPAWLMRIFVLGAAVSVTVLTILLSTTIIIEYSALPALIAARDLAKQGPEVIVVETMLAPLLLPKYFHEVQGSAADHHADGRFASTRLSAKDRRDTQIQMVRAYFAFCEENNVESWLAHGSLLGWFWSEHQLPWDDDVDVQITIDTMARLGHSHNGTIYNYTAPATTGGDDVQTRQYLLDINPAYAFRSFDRENIIDARWIDIHNGRFVDITGVSENQPRLAPDIWACKNQHRYHTRDIWPLREATYENITAYVPADPRRILSNEYGGRALINEVYNGHRWDAKKKAWFPNPTQPPTNKADSNARPVAPLAPPAPPIVQTNTQPSSHPETKLQTQQNATSSDQHDAHPLVVQGPPT